MHYFVLPIISLIMFLLIAFESHQDSSRILLGSIITSGISGCIGVVNASTVYDQNIGIYDDILAIKPKFSQYWLPKIILAAMVISAEVVILAGIGLIGLSQYMMLMRLILLLPLIILIGIIFALFATVWGIKRTNPYWLGNIISGGLVLVSGVIIPVSQYPMWLRWIAEFFPISNLLDTIVSPKLFDINLLLCITKSILWLMICGMSVKIVNKTIRM